MERSETNHSITHLVSAVNKIKKSNKAGLSPLINRLSRLDSLLSRYYQAQKEINKIRTKNLSRDSVVRANHIIKQSSFSEELPETMIGRAVLHRAIIESLFNADIKSEWINNELNDYYEGLRDHLMSVNHSRDKLIKLLESELIFIKNPDENQRIRSDKGLSEYERRKKQADANANLSLRIKKLNDKNDDELLKEVINSMLKAFEKVDSGIKRLLIWHFIERKLIYAVAGVLGIEVADKKVRRELLTEKCLNVELMHDELLEREPVSKEELHELLNKARR